MTSILAVGNGLVGALILLCGVLYPSLKGWTYLACGVFALHLVLEVVIAQAKLFDASKIAVWVLQVLGSLASAAVLLPYNLGWGDWWSLLAAAELGFMLLITFIAVRRL